MSEASRRRRLAVVVLNYRTPELVLACLASLEGQVDGARDAVVVVDNASGDGSADHVASELARRGWTGWARLVRSEQNGGFSAGNNLGIESVDADAYLLLNSDTVVRPGALADLLEGLASDPRVGMVSPRLEGPDGDPQRSCFRYHTPASELIRGAATGVVTRLFRSYVVSQPLDDAPALHEWTSFAAVMIKKEVFDEVGLLDDGYFMYFEDTDFCRRMRPAGWKILHWPAARVVHTRGGSSEVKSRVAARERPPAYLYASRARYFLKHYGRVGLWCANVMWSLGACVDELRALVQRRRRARCDREGADTWSGAFARMPDARGGTRGGA
ncbi:MAG: glycosyltransferase family 2 protein [Planctomycetota bacterium]